jgi:hypothetical protein
MSLVKPVEWKILRRAMQLGIERGITTPCGTLFILPWNRDGSRQLSSRFETARLCVFEQLAPEYAIAEAEFHLISLRTAKAAATRTANLLKKLTADFGPVAAQHKLTEMQLGRAQLEARYGTAPDPAIITEIATNWQRRRFDAILASAEKNRMMQENRAQEAAMYFEGMRSHSKYYGNAENADVSEEFKEFLDLS